MNTFIPEIYRRMGTSVAVDLGAATKIGEIDANVDTLKTQLTNVPGHIDATVDSVKTALSSSSQKTDAAVAGLQSLVQTGQQTDGTRHQELLLSAAGLLAMVQAEQQAAATRQQELLKRLDELEKAIPVSGDADGDDEEEDDEDDDEEGGDEEDDEDDSDDEAVPDITSESAPRVAALAALQLVVLNGTSTANDYQLAFNKADAVLKKFLLPTAVQADWLALVLPPSGWAARSERYWAVADLIDTLAGPLDPVGAGAAS